MLETTSGSGQPFNHQRFMQGALLQAHSRQTTEPDFVSKALGAAAGQSGQQTFTFGWKGEGTSSWGDPGKWIQIEWLLCLIGTSRPAQSNYDCWGQYDSLLAIQMAIQCPECHSLDNVYSVRDASKVYRFLQEHDELVGFLLEAYPQIEKHFGPAPQVKLQVISDPEGHGLEQLFAYIHTSLPVQEALSRLELLDEEWFLDQIDRVGDVFNFNVEIA